MANIVAETDRLVLRRERDGDRLVWLAHMNTAEVMEYLGGRQTIEQVTESFDRMALTDVDGALPFALVALKGEGTLIGKCGLARIDGSAGAPDAIKGQVHVGWTLRADCWGHGYAREAAEAMLGLAFERFGLATVFGQTSESNRASWRLMERLGMRRCADLDYPDPDYPPQHNPTMVYRLDAADWRSRASGGISQAHV
jgi:RimJ/RimL family protein N-acetyltransferase